MRNIFRGLLWFPLAALSSIAIHSSVLDISGLKAGQQNVNENKPGGPGKSAENSNKPSYSKKSRDIKTRPRVRDRKAPKARSDRP